MQNPGSRTQPPAVVQIGDCELNFATRECRRSGQPVKVRRLVFDLLALLIARRPATVSRAEILALLWKRNLASPSVIARTVLEARRAIGDDADAPRYILNVHGVGYRFSSAPGEGSDPAALAMDDPLREVRRMLVAAQTIFEPRDAELAQSQVLTESAMALAVRHGYTHERGRALSWLGYVAAWRGEVEQAAGYVAQAMRLAESEGHELLLARVRVSDAALRLDVGDSAGAAAQLGAAHEVLARLGDPIERFRCEGLLAVASRDAQDHESARSWCKLAFATAQAHDMPRHVHHAEAQLIATSVEECKELETRHGPSDDLASRLQALLVHNDEHLASLNRHAEPWLWTNGMGQRALLLCMLGRFDEACTSLSLTAAEMSALSESQGLRVLEMYAAIELAWAEISLRRGQPKQALRRLLALFQADWAKPLRKMPYGAMIDFAVDVAERCGRLDLALAWCRRRIEEQGAEDKRQSVLLTKMLFAKTHTSDLRRELDTARQTLYRLQRQNADLQQRLSGTGSADGARLAAT